MLVNVLRETHLLKLKFTYHFNFQEIPGIQRVQRKLILKKKKEKRTLMNVLRETHPPQTKIHLPSLFPRESELFLQKRKRKWMLMNVLKEPHSPKPERI